MNNGGVKNRWARRGRGVALALLLILFVVALQAAAFFREFAPRVDAANALLYDLAVENAQRTLYSSIALRIESLVALVAGHDTADRTLGDAWDDFDNHFPVAPHEAAVALNNELPSLTASLSDEAGNIAKITADLGRLQAIYADSYRELQDDLRHPPAYLWPTASLLADRSGYRQAVTLNRALYLAHTGEIGTARVMLAGLNATVEDRQVLATIFYTLGRLQFELFRATPEADYYTQSLDYLRQALSADPELQLAQRLLDFLLSLPQAATAPQAAEGRPETPSEGEGAAISPEKRVF